MRNSSHHAGLTNFLAQQNAQPDKKRLNRTLSGWLKALLIPILLLILCEFLVRNGYIEAYLLPAPSSLWQSFWDLAQSDLLQHIYISTWRVLIGFALGSGLALIFAVWVGLSKEVEAYLEPSFSALKSIPSLAWIPLLLLWLGIDESSKITLIAIGAFFPTYTNTVAAIHNVDRKLIEVGKVYHLNALQRVISIVLPAASSGILTGLRNSLSLSWMFMIAAELIAATQGIGYLLSDGRETSRPDIVIIAIILLALLGKISDTLMKRLENRLLRWRDSIHKQA
ncbi:ABC transporter permease [Acinetobacter gyllenbergii]|uniref:NitT/TauT family transport system permease n=1 Tax=Acinetobacter gyllenbergii CIP 110306 = MTCC 11365 TaxID=1217657 RepID=A0A829HHB7_9GAMM|nr:ABC transporter permease [Acinetobacter gyllenbergii]EPF83382.1 NitT/TauT family transport system permease [Acinetobacter gyllenbergii CIP 110306 = MTCC 11365]EPH35459.1 Alkanesulfonates transport system permease protein [Acinetobacter gyllenbergii CIP 110306 = MTCC 11365]GMA12025.1 ABC transporter permease [Acinetobacter gyllenbergii]